MIPPYIRAYLPSKKLAGAVAILLVLISASVLFVQLKKRVDTGNDTISLGDAAEQYSEQDADADGLKDWEEALWGTDAKNADTDGDGSQDSEEIRADRNPLIAGPDDILVRANTSSQSSLAEKLGVSDNNLTDILSRETFAGIMALKQGGTLDQKSVQDFSAEVFSQAVVIDLPPRYTLAQITVIDTNDKASVKMYAETIKAVSEKYLARTSENELAIIAAALNENDKKELEKLTPLIAEYTAMIKELRAIPVPKNGATLHLSLINAYANIVTSFENMGAIIDDPVRGLIGLGQYDKNIGLLPQIGKSMRRYFLSFGVTL